MVFFLCGGGYYLDESFSDGLITVSPPFFSRWFLTHPTPASLFCCSFSVCVCLNDKVQLALGRYGRQSPKRYFWFLSCILHFILFIPDLFRVKWNGIQSDYQATISLYWIYLDFSNLFWTFYFYPRLLIVIVDVQDNLTFLGQTYWTCQSKTFQGYLGLFENFMIIPDF